ncbi:zinc finger BED domain-containing protein RICESLEEPER 2-like [Rutidosis leptorrhynchoides]|uniref:zinc finger BED domain-containing protein RICESLEEPER 2-like n=1 Tax=Rutidosis leptorrhynchoides TaxID=125765 RepID=UPI003A9984C8
MEGTSEMNPISPMQASSSRSAHEYVDIDGRSYYPTANLYLIEVYKVKQVLDNGANSEDQFVRDMVKSMKVKFDKYWGECHLLMAIASVLDPRFKKWLIGMSYHKLYTPDQAVKNIKEVEDALEDMYKEYLETHDALIKEAATNGIRCTKGSNRFSEDTSNGSGWEEYEKYIKEVDLQKPQVSELKIDVLAIPISTVASEATFSAGGRVIEPFRSSLAPDTVEMLICAGDWIRQSFGLKKKVKEELPIEITLPDVKKSN